MKKAVNNSTEKSVYSKHRLIVSALVLSLVIAVTVISLLRIHSRTEKECWQNLRDAAKAADVQMGALVDNTFAYLENTGTMLADIRETDRELLAGGVSKSRIGNMQMEMRLYFPDGSAFTAAGILEDVSDSFNYAETLDSLDAESRFISCVKKDLIDPELAVMEFFVPVRKDGETTALASAVMDLNKLQDQIVSGAYDGLSRVYYLDTRDGMMFLDNDHKQVYPLSMMSSRVDKHGNSLQRYLDEAMNRQVTSTTVMSDRFSVPALMYSIPSEVNENWEVTIVIRESNAFAAETNVRKAIIAIAAAEILISVLYLTWLMYSIKSEQADLNRANEEQRKVLADNNARLLALEDNFVSFMDVDLETGNYELHVKEQANDHGICAQLVKGNNFFEDTVNNAAAIYPEDLDSLKRVLNADYIREALKENSHFDFYYRLLADDEPVWAKLRMVYKDADKQSVIIGTFNAENDVEAKQLVEQKERLEESLSFTNYFLNTFYSAFYVDLKTREFLVYKEPPSSMVRKNTLYPDYLQILTAFIAKAVVPEDLEEIVAIIQPEKVKELLQNGEFSHNFRDNISGAERMMQIQLIPGADEDHAVFGFRDVTGEYQAQQKRLLGAVPISPDILSKENIGMWAFELDEGQPPRMYGDEAMLKLVGLDHQVPPEEMYHAWYDHIDADSYDLVQNAVDKMILGEHAEVQYPWHNPNGETMIVRCGGVRNPEYDKGIRVEGTHQDVTEVLHFDDEERRALADTNARLFALADNFESLYDVNLETGDYDQFVKGQTFSENINTKLVEKREFFEDSLKNIDLVVYPEDREEFAKVIDREYIRKVLADDNHFDYNYRLLVNGAPVWFRMRLVYKDEDKTNVIFGIFNAEKERETQQLQEAYKLAEQANTSNKLVLGFMNGIKWSYFINDNDEIIGAKYGESATESYDVGHPADPMSWTELVHPDDREQVVGDFMDTIRDRSGEKQCDMTYRLMGTDGKYHWTKISGRVFPRENGIRELFGISIDVSDQMEKEREQQHQLAEALSMAESANRAKTTFLNNMSHDIRTPMNAIIGFTGLAASHIDNKQQVQDYLAKIAQSSDHLLSLINDVLDMSRIESGKMNLNEKEENLPDIIHTLRDIIQADIRSKQIDFFVDAVDVNDENIICDKLRLNQVLLNVLSNAVKYTAPGGTVIMRITEKTVKKSGYAEYEFNIRDNGMGMDKDFLETIFDPFTRVKSSTISGIQGTGLGMAITKNIIDMMGGRIDISSELNKGTEVTIVFDFKLQSAPRQPIEIPELKGVRALVVDDDLNTCLSICSMLEDVGMHDEWCTSGKEAVVRAEVSYRKGDSFKVYVIDWLMPDMNGIETTRRIRKVIGDDAPIIILTAYDWSDIEEEAMDAGVTAFVSKPMFPSDLHRVLNKCLGKVSEPQKPEKNDDYDFSGKKVLLVEDNELNREIATELLTEYGFTVDTAEDGVIAVEKMKSAAAGYYDLILMDVQMPNMDGYEATRRIRALPPEDERVPIIAMTANAFEEDRRKALEAGMDEHIAKPIDIAKLKETLAKFLK